MIQKRISKDFKGDYKTYANFIVGLINNEFSNEIFEWLSCPSIKKSNFNSNVFTIRKSKGLN